MVKKVLVLGYLLLALSPVFSHEDVDPQAHVRSEEAAAIEGDNLKAVLEDMDDEEEVPAPEINPWFFTPYFKAVFFFFENKYRKVESWIRCKFEKKPQETKA